MTDARLNALNIKHERFLKDMYDELFAIKKGFRLVNRDGKPIRPSKHRLLVESMLAKIDDHWVKA